jgi:HD-like signal output (HDOD) protein
MGTRSILLAVTEPQMLVDITQALGPGWETASAGNELDALAQVEKRAFDAVLVDFNLGSPDASDFLNQALEKHPKTTQFLFAYEADLALVAAKVNGTPHILPKPIDPASLKNRIENGVRDSSSKESPSERANAPAVEPAKIPAIYAEVLKALESPAVTNEQVGEIIGRDAALTSEIFRLTNPSYLGLPRNITRPVEAVESLGLEAVKGAVMALQFLAEHKRLKPGYLSLEQLWQHSMNVGQIARDLVFFETKDRAQASQALLAGLLHDLGKVVLAKNFEDLYGRVYSLARKQPVALWDIEKEMFGANHGEIGACLVGMWNMPAAIVDATALHHEPAVGDQPGLSPLAAVHIANVLERELWPNDEGMMVRPIIDTPFLNQLGLLQRLPIWRASLANRRAVDLDKEAEPSAQSDLAVRSEMPREQTEHKSSPFDADLFPWKWVWAGAAGLMVLLAVWFRPRPDLNQGEPAYARTPTPQQQPAVAVAPVTAAPPQPVPAAAQQQPAPLIPIWESPAAPPTETVANPAASAATAQPTNAVPPKKPQPAFRLQGIIYSSTSPSAIVNGQRVNAGDQVDGATVVGIGRTTVTLLIKGERRTFQLR